MCRILYRLLVSLAGLAVRSGRSKDLEIIVLRHQLTVLHRLNNRPALAEEDRALLGAIAAALPRRRRDGWLVTPETLLRWHRRRIARHWTRPCRRPGRPCTSVELRRLIIEMATNTHTRALLRDRASQFTGDFEEIFRTEGIKILKTPVRAPIANAFAERWIGTLRRELLDRTIIWNQRQLQRLVIDYIAHYNAHRPHRSLEQRPPRHTTPDNNTTGHPLPLRLVRTTRCDGLINEYKHAA